MVNSQHFLQQINCLVIGYVHVIFCLKAEERHLRIVFVAEPLSDHYVRFQPIFLHIGSDVITAKDLPYLEELIDVVHSFEDDGLPKNLHVFMSTKEANQQPVDHKSRE